MGRLWTRVRAPLDVARGWFPLTPSGVLVGGFGGWALRSYGLGRLDFVLLIVGGVAAVLVALALLATMIAAIAIRRGRGFTTRSTAIEGDCDSPVRTGFSMPRRAWLPLLSVQWRWASPAATVDIVAHRGRLEEEVVAHRRGVSEAIERRFEIGDVFGLTHVRFVAREARRVRFSPSVGKLDVFEVIRGVSGGDDFAHPEGPPDGSPYDLRPYVPGDPLRFVLWKVYARTRELVVRAPERALSPARQAAAYLVVDAADEPAAGAARLAVDRGALGNDWVLGADGVGNDATDAREAVDLLARSAGVDMTLAGEGLKSFFERVAPTGQQRAVVFVPGRRGPWIERVRASFDARSGTVEFVVCTDGVVDVPRGRWWRRWLDRRPDALDEAGVTTVEEVAAVVRELSGPHARVMVLDRRNGAVYAEAHLQKMGSERAASKRASARMTRRTRRSEEERSTQEVAT
jgi:uncharacterized protein (DUF58 family)